MTPGAEAAKGFQGEGRGKTPECYEIGCERNGSMMVRTEDRKLCKSGGVGPRSRCWPGAQLLCVLPVPETVQLLNLTQQ